MSHEYCSIPSSRPDHEHQPTFKLTSGMAGGSCWLKHWGWFDESWFDIMAIQLVGIEWIL